MPDAVLLVGDSYSDPNLFYTTHFLAGDPFVYIQSNGQSTLVVNSMERGRAEKESSAPEVRTFDDYGYRDLVRTLDDRTRAFTGVVGRIVTSTGSRGVTVGPAFSALLADALRNEGITVAIDPHLLAPERRQKSPEEIAAIEEAQRATERATKHAIMLIEQSKVRDGVLYTDGTILTSERLRAEIDVALTRDDMDTSHSPIVAGGGGAADPHWAGSGPLKAGEAIVLDVFPRSKRTRYFADMTRTVVKGTPPEELQAMYDSVLRAQEAAFSAIRAGANGQDVHRAVEEVFKRDGYSDENSGPRFTHGTGHGVGLDIHEPPYLGHMDNELLENEVVTVEPGLYDPTIGAIRIEDLVLVTSEGYRNLTDFPKRFVL